MRGRPTAAATHLGKEFSDSIKKSMQNKTTRTHATQAYCTAVFPLLNSEAASDIPFLNGIFHIVNHNGYEELYQKKEIIEQLGRMLEQDKYSEKDVLTVARIAAKAYHDGCTVKQIKAYILNGRKNGEW